LLARELARLGDVEQVVVTGRGSELAARLRRDGVPVRSVRWSAGLDPRVLPGLVAELRQPPAMVHAHDGHAVTLAGIGAGLTGRPLIVTRRVQFPLRRRGFWTRAARVIAVSRAVADADLFTMSSREEGLGTSVLEAMVLGIPVASTAAGGLPEMLQDGAGVLAPPENPDALAGAVARLLSEPGLARSVVARASLAVQEFTAARMAAAVRSVYRSCAHSFDGS
jgi:glycosyltransferase involved in cell wall biosynthesis